MKRMVSEHRPGITHLHLAKAVPFTYWYLCVYVYVVFRRLRTAIASKLGFMDPHPATPHAREATLSPLSLKSPAAYKAEAGAPAEGPIPNTDGPLLGRKGLLDAQIGS